MEARRPAQLKADDGSTHVVEISNLTKSSLFVHIDEPPAFGATVEVTFDDVIVRGDVVYADPPKGAVVVFEASVDTVAAIESLLTPPHVAAAGLVDAAAVPEATSEEYGMRETTQTDGLDMLREITSHDPPTFEDETVGPGPNSASDIFVAPHLRIAADLDDLGDDEPATADPIPPPMDPDESETHTQEMILTPHGLAPAPEALLIDPDDGDLDDALDDDPTYELTPSQPVLPEETREPSSPLVEPVGDPIAPEALAVTPSAAEPVEETFQGMEPDDELPRLDGQTLRFASVSQFRSQYKANIMHGALVVSGPPMPIGSQVPLDLLIPGVEAPPHISGHVRFLGEGTVGVMIDSFGLVKQQLEALVSKLD